MDIYRAEKIAQDRMAHASGDDWDKRFTLVGPGGVLACEWLDPYFGMFKVEGKEGFLMTRNIPSSVECLMSEDESEAVSSHSADH